VGFDGRGSKNGTWGASQAGQNVRKENAARAKVTERDEEKKKNILSRKRGGAGRDKSRAEQKKQSLPITREKGPPTWKLRKRRRPGGKGGGKTKNIGAPADLVSAR